VDASYRWIRFLDRSSSVLLVTLLALAVLAFGGLVWWFPVFAAVVLTVLAGVIVIRAWVGGSFAIFAGPAPLLALMAIVLGVFQIVPLPAGLMGRHSVRSIGHWTSSEGAGSTGPEKAGDTTPFVQGRILLSADRPATLRWVLAATACLAVFVVAGHFADRLRRLKLVWGALVVAFGICTWSGCLQIAGQCPGAFGLYSPGSGPAWAPSRSDLRSGPVVTRLRSLERDPKRPAVTAAESFLARVDPTFAVGSLVTGPSAYLALGSLVLPLMFGLALHRLSPRGSREPLAVRLRPSGGVTPLLILVATIWLTAALMGYLGGMFLGAVLLAGGGVVTVCCLRGAGVARSALGLLLSSTLALVAGDAIGRSLGRLPGSPWLAEQGGVERTKEVWTEAAQMGARLPVFGVGLNAFGAVHAQVKHDDACSSTAMSSLLQWWAESGSVGMILISLGLAWCLWRLPGAWKRVGAADRPLAGALLGSAVSFGGFSLVAWTVQLPAVALATAALGGTLNRWLAGGTDLFIERE
jgi:hypothetical protein